MVITSSLTIHLFIPQLFRHGRQSIDSIAQIADSIINFKIIELNHQSNGQLIEF